MLIFTVMEIDTSFLREQILLRMRFDNPWWMTNVIPEDYHNMRHRLYSDMFYQSVSDETLRRAIILMGPRRVGKTVMLFHTIERLIMDGTDPQKIIYLSIDTPIYNNLSLEELFSLAREALKRKNDDIEGYYVFYDEIQYLKDWEIHLKSLVDSYRKVRFIASGSAAAALKMKSNESGAGRFTDFMLPPLTFNEYIHLLDLDHLIVPSNIIWRGRPVDVYDTIDIDLLNRHFINYINYGGYPEIIFSERLQSDPSRFVRHDIVDKVLLRDLPGLYGIQDTQELNRLFIHIVYRSASEFSYEDLSKESGIKKETLKKYIQYLEAAYLIKVVNKIDINARRMQRVTSFKMYLTNPSLRCALFSPLTETDSVLGNMVETAINVGSMKKSAVSSYCFDRKWAVEIKWSDRYYENYGELQSLLQFMEKNGIDSAVVTSIKKSGYKKLDKVGLQFIPAAIYAYIVGKNTLLKKESPSFLGME